MKVTAKPSRRKLMQVICELQRLVGEASAFHGNDRDNDGFEKGQKLLAEAHKLCLDARSFDPPEYSDDNALEPTRGGK